MNKIIFLIIFLIFLVYLVNIPSKKKRKNEIEKFNNKSNLFNSGVVLVKVKSQNINFERPWTKENIYEGSS